MNNIETSTIAQDALLGSGVGSAISMLKHYSLLGASAAITAGTLMGTYLGFKTLTLSDDYVMKRAAYYGIAHNQFRKKIFWYNWATQHAGTFKLKKSFYNEQGHLCKISIVHIGIIQKQEIETICRMPSGDWMIIDNVPLIQIFNQLITILPPNRHEINKQLIYHTMTIPHSLSSN